MMQFTSTETSLPFTSKLQSSINCKCRYCNVGTLLDQAASFANVDIPVILETMTRSSLATFWEVPKLMKEFKDFKSGEHPNYYQAGLSLGKIFKFYMDTNVNN